MKRGQPLKRSSPPRRTSKIRKVGKRAKREEPALRAFRAALAERSPDHCERCLVEYRMAGPADPHHIVGRGRGVGWPKLHSAKMNGLRVCRRCHDILTLFPRAATGLCVARIDRAFREFEAWRSGNPSRSG